MAYVLWRISYTTVSKNSKPPPLISAPPFPLIKSLFFIPLLSRLLVKCSHTEAHCSKGPIHEAKRQWRETQRAPHTAKRAVSSALTPKGCVWAAPRHGGPADSAPGSSLLWTWPFSKPEQLPKRPQTHLQLSIATRWECWPNDIKSEWLSNVCQMKTSEESLPC